MGSIPDRDGARRGGDLQRKQLWPRPRRIGAKIS
jgi:hypothetical protein